MYIYECSKNDIRIINLNSNVDLPKVGYNMPSLIFRIGSKFGGKKKIESRNKRNRIGIKKGSSSNPSFFLEVSEHNGSY